MSSIRNYIENQRNAAGQRYNNFAGQQQPQYANYISQTAQNAGGLAGSRQLAADGGNNAPQSQPYIITIRNSSATSVANFDVLGAYTYINSTGFTNGSLTLSGVTISSAISNVNYQQFLYQSMNQPFSVGLTYIESVSGTSSQVTQTFTLNTQDANGNQMLRTIVPTIDPYQQQSTIVAVKQLYSIDGFTKITFTTVQASVVFRVHFYPATNINLASGLAGQPVSQGYSSPAIMGVPTVFRPNN